MSHPILDILKRVGTSFVGQALPDTQVMSGAFKDLLKATIGAVLAAILVGAFFLMLGLGLYHFLVFQGWAIHRALFLCTSSFLGLALISGAFSKVHFKKVSQKKSQMAFFSGQSGAPKSEPSWKELLYVLLSNVKPVPPDTKPQDKKR